MQDTELFLSLAEIAGVFVGFGALIAVRSGGPTEAQEISYMRAVVVMGMVTIVAALAPVVLDRYGVAGHQAWALSAVVALVGFLVMAGAMARNARVPGELVRGAGDTAPAMAVDCRVRERPALLRSAGPPADRHPAGRGPGAGAAFYLTFVVLIMLGAAWSLLGLVLEQRGSQPGSEPASDPAALPATGGSSA
jgi:hypothetical protein